MKDSAHLVPHLLSEKAKKVHEVQGTGVVIVDGR